MQAMKRPAAIHEALQLGPVPTHSFSATTQTRQRRSFSRQQLTLSLLAGAGCPWTDSSSLLTSDMLNLTGRNANATSQRQAALGRTRSARRLATSDLLSSEWQWLTMDEQEIKSQASLAARPPRTANMSSPTLRRQLHAETLYALFSTHQNSADPLVNLADSETSVLAPATAASKPPPTGAIMATMLPGSCRHTGLMIAYGRVWAAWRRVATGQDNSDLGDKEFVR